jgi:hypothetical protein
MLKDRDEEIEQLKSEINEMESIWQDKIEHD